MSDRPVKPPQIAFTVFKHGAVVKMEVTYRMTSADTSDDYLIAWYGDKTRAEIYNTPEFYEVTEWVGHWPALFRLKEKYRAQVEAFQKWEKSNAAELATFKRLKAKYEPTTQDPQP